MATRYDSTTVASPRPRAREMAFLVVGCTGAILGACGNDAPAPAAASLNALSTSATPSAPVVVVPRRAPDLVPERTAVGGYEVLAFRVVLARARIVIADSAMSTDLGALLVKTGGSLVVNGGFFTPDTRPEGLAVSEGQELSAKSLELGGGVVAILGGRARLFAAEDDVPLERLDFAIQCRPRLVVGGAQHVKKDDGRKAERTALCLRDSGAVLEVVIARSSAPGRGPTLSAWSRLLAARGCEGALNLDGGPSTGAAWREGSAVESVAPRVGIRHAIVVTLPRG